MADISMMHYRENRFIYRNELNIHIFGIFFMNYANKYSKFYFQKWQLLSLEELRKIEIVTMSVASVGALLNSVVIVAMAIDPLKILCKGPWVNILNLAIADLISCMSTCFCIWGEMFFFKGNASELYNTIALLGWGFGTSASFLFLTFLTVQIFLITKFPIKTRYCFTTLKIVSVGIVIWLFAFLLGLIQITRLSYVPLKVNLKIWAAQTGVLLIALVVQFILNILVIVEIIKSGRSTGNAENTKHGNIAKTVVILTLILFTTAFPYFVLRQMAVLSGLGYFGGDKTTGMLFYLSNCFAPIAMVNFAANPILYALRLPDYRQTLLVFIGKRKSKTCCRMRLMQNISPKSANAFPLQRQRALMTSPERQKSSLERLPMHDTDQPV